MSTLHRVLSGTPITPQQLKIAGWFVIGWFCLDLLFLPQAIEWYILKFYPSAIVTCLPVHVPIVELTPNDTLTPLDKRFPGYYCNPAVHNCTILKVE